MILAAIDIGSNAARLLINDVTIKNNIPIFNKLNLFRIPLRLGFDVFENGSISNEKTEMFVNTMKAFNNLMQVYNVSNSIICATSAMRDAKNASEIIEKVKSETNLEIRVISGDEEALIVYENHIAEKLDKKNSYLYIDVGGGSTECSFFSNGILIFKQSFNIGTIRLLKKMVDQNEWTKMKDTLKAVTKGHNDIIAIGSGGNINKVFSMSKKKEGKPLELNILKDYLKEIGDLTIQERISKYGFRDDRADVIVPALEIYTNIMKWTNTNNIFVPKIGLADGLIQHLYYSLK